LCNNTGIATQFFEATIAHKDRSNMSNNTELNVDKRSNEQDTMQQQLADANNEIAELKLQIAWLERSYE
jgi:TolA-binding protein